MRVDLNTDQALIANHNLQQPRLYCCHKNGLNLPTCVENLLKNSVAWQIMTIF